MCFYNLYTFVCVWKKGKDLTVADALSRGPHSHEIVDEEEKPMLQSPSPILYIKLFFNHITVFIFQPVDHWKQGQAQ